MSGGAAPLRFLALVLGGWVCVRAALLMPGGPDEKVEPVALIPPASAAIASRPRNAVELPRASSPPGQSEREVRPLRHDGRVLLASAETNPRLASMPLPVPRVTSPARPPAVAPARNPLPLPAWPSAAAIPKTNRWSVSSWAFFREGGAGQLATGGLLGGSQAGARISYVLTDRLALSGRFYSPLRSKGAEAALGLEWQPSRAIPVRVLAERRQSLGKGGRSAFAMAAYGGVSELALAGPLRLDVYGQAGVVGLRSRDLFVDGALRAGVPIAKDLSAGIGLWGAAQPGVARLDLGPQISLRLPVEGASVRISAEWRLRVAGDAAPGSGPALTLSTDF